MKNKINWIEILTNNEDAILEAGRQAYKDSVLAHYDNSMSLEECVKINEYAEIKIITLQQNWETEDMRNGTAICPINFKRFNVWDNTDEEVAIENSLEHEEFEQFKLWLSENDINRFGISNLREWDAEIANKVDEEMIDWEIDEHMEEQVNTQFEQCIERIKSYSEYID